MSKHFNVCSLFMKASLCKRSVMISWKPLTSLDPPFIYFCATPHLFMVLRSEVLQISSGRSLPVKDGSEIYHTLFSLEDFRPVALSSHEMKVLERPFLAHLRWKVKSSLDLLQYVYQPLSDVEAYVVP